MKRIFLFLLTNVLVMLTVSLIMQIFNVQPYLTHYGIDYNSLLIFCSIWGMTGAFISLLMSKTMAKWAVRLKIIDPKQPGSARELLNMVYELGRDARLPAMPEVGIYESPEINAFATGPSKRNSLVAVSSGLLNSMDKNELKGVLAHEVSHIANGDMVTLTLIQGIVNSFALFLSRVISYFLTSSMREENSYMVRFVIIFLLDIAFSILGGMVVAWFSRRREFRADAGGAKLAGNVNMIAALEKLSQSFHQSGGEKTSISALKISDKKGGFLQLFSTHPPLAERIAALKQRSERYPVQ